MTGPEPVDVDARRAVVVASAEVLHALGIPDARIEVLRGLRGDGAADVGRAERTLFDVDAAIPMPLFRQRFADLAARRDGGAVDTRALAAYASFLARRHARDPARIDRIEYIVTRLLVRELPDGRLQALPEGECFAVLSGLGMQLATSQEERQKAVAFFVGVAQRLGACAGVEELLGGPYTEMRTFKRALRERRLDPAVLYASILASVAVTNALLRFAAVEGVAQSTLLSRIAGTDVAIERILEGGEGDDKKKTKKRKKRLLFDADGRDRRPALVFLGLAAAGAIWLQWGPVASENTPEPLPPRRVVQISPLLSSAKTAHDDDGRVLFGTLDSAAWQKLGAQERRQAAAEIARALQAAHTPAALLYDGERVAVRIENGVVVFAK